MKKLRDIVEFKDPPPKHLGQDDEPAPGTREHFLHHAKHFYDKFAQHKGTHELNKHWDQIKTHLHPKDDHEMVATDLLEVPPNHKTVYRYIKQGEYQNLPKPDKQFAQTRRPLSRS